MEYIESSEEAQEVEVEDLGDEVDRKVEISSENSNKVEFYEDDRELSEGEF